MIIFGKVKNVKCSKEYLLISWLQFQITGPMVKKINWLDHIINFIKESVLPAEKKLLDTINKVL